MSLEEKDQDRFAKTYKALYENPGLLSTPLLAIAAARVQSGQVVGAITETKVIRAILSTLISWEVPGLPNDHVDQTLSNMARVCLENWNAGAFGVFEETQYGLLQASAGENLRLLFRPGGIGRYVFALRVFYELLVALGAARADDVNQFIDCKRQESRAAKIYKYMVGQIVDGDKQVEILDALWNVRPETALLGVSECADKGAFIRNMISYEREDETVAALRSLAYRIDDVTLVDVLSLFFDQTIKEWPYFVFLRADCRGGNGAEAYPTLRKRNQR